MRRLLVLAILAAGILAAFIALRAPAPSYVAPEESGAAAFSPAPEKLRRAAAPGEAVRVFEVQGMCCEGCTGKLFASLTAVPGVRDAAVDLDAGTASVLAGEAVDVAALERALSFDKYTASLRR